MLNIDQQHDFIGVKDYLIAKNGYKPHLSAEFRSPCSVTRVHAYDLTVDDSRGKKKQPIIEVLKLN